MLVISSRPARDGSEEYRWRPPNNGGNRDKGQNRVACPVIPVPAIGVAREPRQRGIAEVVIDRVVYESYAIRIEGDEPMRKRMRGVTRAQRGAGEAGGADGVPPGYRRCVYRASPKRIYIIGAAWNRYRPNVPYAQFVGL